MIVEKTDDIISFPHLSIKDCNGVFIIGMRERQHGKKIHLTSDDYLDLCASLGVEKFGVTG